MAHLAPHTAIFSPSVARAAASTAKDWSYIDVWLKDKYQGRRVPTFERNAETLKALLALISHNESADEKRDQVAQIEAAALEEVKVAEAEKVRRRKVTGPSIDGELIADDVLQAVENGLTGEGKTALDSMANMAVELGMAYPTPESLGSKFVELKSRAAELEQTLERVTLLERYLNREAATMDAFIQELQSDDYKPPADLAKQNLELQRQIKSMSTRLPELRQHVASLEKSVGMPSLTVEEVKMDEEDYLELLAKKKDLDAQVKAFAGLPPDIETARAELEAFRTDLRDATEKRDAVFEGLVERESPAKPRRRA